jgi:radical SAM superfamily enzyme
MNETEKINEKIKEKLNTLLQNATPTENQQLYLKLCQYESSINLQSIMSMFFSEHNLYYVQTSDLYIYYQQHQYRVLNENDIIHLILKNINIYPMNTTLKQQIRYKIHKKIKLAKTQPPIPRQSQLTIKVFFP